MHGFTLIKEAFFSEIGGQARLYKHDKTGAELLSVCNKDTNKSFGVTFRTPPKNSTGVAHILEHSVLCGSQKYPTKEPFVELLKSSLQTFLNAMTYPDKTCYPVASTNLQDFYNLIDVYLDAVFFPRVRTAEGKDILAQEGWHIDTKGNSPDSWIFKGVVYNEMKGVYSSPDSLLAEESQHSIFPDTLYSLDSGGQPNHIIDLSYEEFADFHSKYYHPSNSRFFFWGDDEESTRLEKVNQVIKSFDAIQVDSQIPLQKHIDIERKIEISFECSDEEKNDNPEEAKGHATVNWLLCPSNDIENSLVLTMLDHILTALPGSPLRKALLESGLGEDIAGGLECDLAQMYYSIGLRSMTLGSEDTMEALILDTLAELAETGIDSKMIEAAVNSTEFALRENNSGRFPRGLATMTHCLTLWLYDNDPFLALAWEAPLADLKKRIESGEKVFENAIENFFLKNMHRTLVNLIPDTQLAHKRAEEEQAHITKIYNNLNESERLTVIAESERLQEIQTKEDSHEALATIPILTIQDLPTENTLLPIEKKEQTLPIYVHDIDTTGILYARIVLSLDALPYRLLPLLPLYTRVLTEVGTKNYNFIELGLEIEASTGGLAAYSSFQSIVNSPDTLNSFVLTGKATKDKIHHLIHLMEEVLFEPHFDNKERFTQMVLEEKARLEQALIPAGHSIVATRLGGMISHVGSLNELTNGVSYLNEIRELTKRLENNWQSVLSDLYTIHQTILNRENALLDLTADSALLAQAIEQFNPLLSRIPATSQQSCVDMWQYPTLPQFEALTVPARVNYVGIGTNLHQHGYNFHGSALVISRFLRMGYLWDRVRVQGGAYGCFSQYSRVTGSFCFVSYRDPHVENTLNIYKKAPQFLADLKLSERDLTCAIIGTIGDMDTYLLPDAQGSTALWRELSKDTKEIRQKIRDEVLSTTLKDFHNFAAPLAKALENANLVSLGGTDTAEYAKKNNWTTFKLL